MRPPRGIRGADLRNDGTPTDPQHTRGGELRRFDRVASSPPFSQNYDCSLLSHTERFIYAAAQRQQGRHDVPAAHAGRGVAHSGVATVIPHGVLFGGGEEGPIRRKIIEVDSLDTVIGLGPKLLYGTGIPAAILTFAEERQASSAARQAPVHHAGQDRCGRRCPRSRLPLGLVPDPRWAKDDQRPLG